MPTIIEIKNPKLTYCNKYETHCPCHKCKKFLLYPKNPLLYHCLGKRKTICTNCPGPKDIFKKYPSYKDRLTCEEMILSHEYINRDKPIKFTRK
jgi:hypothetical protein